MPRRSSRQIAAQRKASLASARARAKQAQDFNRKSRKTDSSLATVKVPSIGVPGNKSQRSLTFSAKPKRASKPAEPKGRDIKPATQDISAREFRVGERVRVKADRQKSLQGPGRVSATKIMEVAGPMETRFDGKPGYRLRRVGSNSKGGSIIHPAEHITR